MSPRCFLRRENHFKGEFIVCDLFLLRRKLKYYSTDVKQQSINIGVHQQEYDTDASIRQGLPPAPVLQQSSQLYKKPKRKKEIHQNTPPNACHLPDKPENKYHRYKSQKDKDT